MQERDKIRLQELAHKWLKGSLTVAEQQEFDLWFKQSHDNPMEVPETIALDEESHERAIFAKIQTELGIVPQRKTTKLWPRVAGIAAAVAAITLGVWLYYTNEVASSRNASRNDGMVVNDIAPGKNTATIKIGDGEAITLSDQQTGVVVGDDLRYSDNTLVIQSGSLSSRANAKDLTVSTPRGGTYQITLPDGTKVWLNAASVLTYTMPLKERGGVRQVELSGEAYFEVFRNKKQAFVVTTKNLTTTVLGTHFNISAYDDEQSAKATLLEGSVKVAPHRPSATSPREGEGLDGGEAIVLKPNQQAAVTGSSELTVKQVNPEDAIAWKNGYFMFNNESLESVMERIARWYNVKVIFEDAAVKTGTVFGTISRFENVSKVLRMLERADVVQFTIEGNTIKIKRKK